MDDSFDDIFDNKDEENSEVTNTVEQTPETTTDKVSEPVEAETETTSEATETEQTEEQPRDDKGQFASKRNWVPVEALVAERQRAQAAAQRAAEIEAQLREIEEAKRQSNRPDPFEQPDEFHQFYDEQIRLGVQREMQRLEAERQQQEIAQRNAGVFADFETKVAKHPQEVVQEALDYALARGDEQWAMEGLRQDDPIQWMLDHKNRHAQFEDYMRDPDGFVARQAAERGIVAAPAATTQPHMAATAAPRSLASIGSGRTAPPTAQTMSEAFDAIFDKK